jgi:hypothetical protein
MTFTITVNMLAIEEQKSSANRKIIHTAKASTRSKILPVTDGRLRNRSRTRTRATVAANHGNFESNQFALSDWSNKTAFFSLFVMHYLELIK